MRIDALPIHPTTGLQALGIGRRGPIWPILGGSGDPDPVTGNVPADPAAPPQEAPVAGEPDAPPAFTPITSQEDLDRILGRRLGQERAKYSGFDDLKAKADKYDDLENSKKSTEQRLTDELGTLRKENEELRLDRLRSDVARDKGLPAKYAGRLKGTTREELEADADDIAEDFPKPEPKVALSQKPKENLRGGGKPDEEPEETDPRKLAAKIPR